METSLIIRTIIEAAAVLFIIWGLFNEKRLIRFEDRILRFIAGLIISRRRKKAAQQNLARRRKPCKVKPDVSDPSGKPRERNSFANPKFVA